jgi:hypothetical protein
MHLTRVGCVVLLLVALAGCSEVVYSDADEGATRELRQGSSFGVSLPKGQYSADGTPKIEGALVRYLGHSREEDTSRDLYRFRADGAGEALIRIPSEGASLEPFVIRVRITPASAHHAEGPTQAPSPGKPY